MGNFHHQALMVCALVSAYTAPALMTVCLLTDHWISGNQTRLSPNLIIKPGDKRPVNYTYHRIGLWRECMKESIDIPYTCEIVKYSKTEAKLEKGFKAVSYRSAPSMACFTGASGLLTIAMILFTRGLCKRRRKAVFFISGLLFSISGLLTMVGVTLYVSITTEESIKFEQNHPVMGCSYGFSFLCAIFSFVLQELTGVLTVYWFIYRFRALVRKQEKLRARTRQLMGDCFTMTTALPMNLISINHANRHHPNQNHTRYPYASNDLISPLIQKQQQKRRIPFDRSRLPVSAQRLDKTAYPVFPPTQTYGDYCRVLIRTKDMDLLAQMVKSKSHAQLVANSRPITPAAISNSHVSRRNSLKGVKRTTSV